MSLDRRIRDGFAQTATEIQPDVEAHLARSRRSFHRRRTTRRIALVAGRPSWRPCSQCRSP
jgi:hypothetical protein